MDAGQLTQAPDQLDGDDAGVLVDVARTMSPPSAWMAGRMASIVFFDLAPASVAVSQSGVVVRNQAGVLNRSREAPACSRP